ncbi:hypothetical protein PGT21_016102 [Puccinia graminis f. sp. tritici]|uniref:Uncharacterized protein n=2 Tax=Puccinia graminis f. sp. tritici TaxID=56615 RepID=E3KXT3_PUCGT|nr:uncharacterized protein PGTG_14986 [Puccinia graminis f. sp. tritici CRL 75-36-700-3]EFP89145.2 hypothetical protein PGTG_14986 [Puccinia graminis f. sp. tritici CRL 75-36-700-3]KAA1103375.1 hypothetical protein PGT21_016102 [Puccinia graminis f. sp. tritici]
MCAKGFDVFEGLCHIARIDLWNVELHTSSSAHASDSPSKFQEVKSFSPLAAFIQGPMLLVLPVLFALGSSFPIATIHFQDNRNHIGMASTVSCDAYLATPTEQTVFSFDVPISSETETVAVLKRRVTDQVERKKATLLGMYVGDKQIDSTEHEHSTLLKDIVPVEALRKIRCKVEMKTADVNSDRIIAGSGAVLGAVASPFLTQASIAAAGFGAQGIVAGTPAAALMASYGGSVGSGSACAILQSIGAAGLGVGGVAVAAGVGGFLAYQGARRLVGQRSPHSNKGEDNQQASQGAENGTESSKDVDDQQASPSAEKKKPSGTSLAPGPEEKSPSLL